MVTRYHSANNRWANALRFYETALGFKSIYPTHPHMQRKFLFVSLTGLIGDIAWQVLKEGHEVRYFIANEEERDIADGFVPKTDDWEGRRLGRRHRLRRHARPGRKAQRLRGAARPSSAARLTPTGSRTTARSARKSSRRPASRSSPTGISTTSTRPSSTSGQPDPLRHQALRRGRQRQAAPLRRRRGGRPRRHPHARGLQEGLLRRDQGLPAPEAGRRASRSRSARSSTARNSSTPININFEHKKLFPGNIGPPTGEMGTAMFWSEPNRIFDADAHEDGAKLGRGGLRRLHRRQLHRQQQRHLSARVHLALRLPDDHHPAGRHDHADRPLPRDLATAATRS